MMIRRIGLLTLAALLACPALAQSKKELAARVVALQSADYEALGRNMAAQTAQQVLQAAGQALQQIPPEKREAVGKDIQAEVRKFHDAIAPMLGDSARKIGPVVAQPMLEEFSEDELKAVIAYLESPASKKMRDLNGQLPNAITEKLVGETRGTVEPKIKALEGVLQGKLKAALPAGAAAPAAPATKPASGTKK